MTKILTLAIVAVAIIVVIASSSILLVDASVMGIDFGIESIKIAAPKNNNMDIILNEQSHRKSWNAVGFRSDERFFADEAKNLAARFPDNMFLGVNRLVGVNINDTALHNDWYRNTLNYKANIQEFKGYVDEENDNKTANDQGYAGVAGTLELRTGSNPDIAYSAESLTAMLYTYIKSTVEKDSRLKVTDAVVTVPAYFDRRQRQSMIDAAELAGLRVISLMHPTTAAALQYGMNRRGFGNDTVTILVLDVGSAHTDAGVYTFTPPPPTTGKNKKKVRNVEALGTIQTRAIVSTKEVGGRVFDSCLARYIEDKFVAANPKTNQRVLQAETLKQRKSVVSLMRAANKAKEMLSANRAAPVIVEGINPDRDFPITITREEFESTCAPLFESIPKIVNAALDRAGVKMEDLTAFEMFGAGTRVPRVFEDLTKMRTDGRPVDRTLNTDEAAALGAGFYAGALAGRFRIKSFAVSETIGAVSQLPTTTSEQNITFSLTPKPNADPNKPVAYRTLYHANSKYGARKSITVQRDVDFGVYVYHSFEDSKDTENINHEKTRQIERFVNVTGLDKALESVYYYYAADPVKEINGESDDAEKKTEEEQQKAQEDEAANANRKQVNGRYLRHNNNSHQIRVDFRLSESGIIEVEGAELRATYIQNVSKKTRVNLTDSEIEEAKEKAKTRVIAQEEARLAKKAEEEAARKANMTEEERAQEEADEAAAAEAAATESATAEDAASTTDNNETASSEDAAAADDSTSNSSSKKVKKPTSKKKPENATAVLERKLKIALNAVRTYRVETKYVEEARKKTVPLSIQQSFLPPTPHLSNDKTLAKRILRALDDIDRIKRETSAAKNDLEAYIVWAKNEGIIDNKQLRDLKLLEEEGLEQKIVDALSAASDWLEEDGYGDDVPKSAFDDKLKELHVITGPVIDKFQELTQPKKKSSKTKKTSKKSSKKTDGDEEESGSSTGEEGASETAGEEEEKDGEENAENNNNQEEQQKDNSNNEDSQNENNNKEEKETSEEESSS